jgi:hypothetical protein
MLSPVNPEIISHFRLQMLEKLLTEWLAKDLIERSCPCCFINQAKVMRIAAQKTPCAPLIPIL